MTTKEILEGAKEAKKCAASLGSEIKNKALEYIAEELLSSADTLLSENERDIENAKGKISDVMIDRLRLTPARIEGMAKGIREVASLPDPCGRVLDEFVRPDGLRITKTAVAIGVIAIIYESRPNVTADAAALCLKSGNVCILRSGKEAYNSSKAVVACLRRGLVRAGLDERLVSLIDDTTRESASELMRAEGFIDLLIPRGGAGLIRACTENATVPCIATGTGICHIYVDESADEEKALAIIKNAKTSRPSVCNAEEVCLVHKNVAGSFLPKLKKMLVDERRNNGEIPVELRLCQKSASIIEGTPASDTDFDTEFLDYILAVKTVEDVNEAIEHISLHSTHHSEAIVTSDKHNAELFTKFIDSAAVYVNASTRFTDGGEFGLGCEMGISTQKLHARGPMGLRELTTYKYIVVGDGHVRI